MDSIIVSRFSEEMDDSILGIFDDDSHHHHHHRREATTTTTSRRRSYDRYDTDPDLYADDTSDCSEELASQLRSNSPDFFRLELDEPLDIQSLLEAIQVNQTVREVEVHIEALEGLNRPDQQALANALVGLPELRSLLVYKNSSCFVQALLRYPPFLLRHLRLCKLDIGNNPDSMMQELASALKRLPHLRSLDVGFEALDSEAVLQALFELKPVYVGLESFRVDYRLLQNDNHTLDDRIVSVLAQAIEQSETMKSLSLPPFDCTDQCHQTLIEMLQQNCVLERIDYWVRVCNLFYPGANEAIDHLLQLNASGVRRLLKKQGGISQEELVEQLAPTSQQNDLESIYHLFSSDPSLVPQVPTK